MIETEFNYKIGSSYKYPNSHKVFILESVNDTETVFRFKGGHWCTDSVFLDLINVGTGIQVYEDNQIELKLF